MGEVGFPFDPILRKTHGYVQVQAVSVAAVEQRRA